MYPTAKPILIDLNQIIKKIQNGERILSPQEEKLIIGGEATMWTEHVSQKQLTPGCGQEPLPLQKDYGPLKTFEM